MYYYYAAVVASFDVTRLLVSGCAGSTVPCAAGLIYYSSPALPTATTNTFNTALVGFSVPSMGGFVAPSRNLIYAASSSTTAGTGGLYKFTNAAGTLTGAWTSVAPGAFRAVGGVATLGAHALSGRMEAGRYILYVTTPAATANCLYRYDTSFDSSSVAGAGWALLATASAGQAFRSVFVGPVDPLGLTATPPETFTPSWTMSSTPSLTASSSATQTSPSSPSTTGSLSPTVSRGASQSNSPSSSGTGSSSNTQTPSSSQTPSQTPSSSQTPSNTPTSSQTPSNTPTASGTRPGHFFSPFTLGSLLVQRTVGTASFIDEVDVTSGLTLQSATMRSASCSWAVGQSDGYPTNSPDGSMGFFTCASGSLTRNVARVHPNGTVNLGANYATNNAAYGPRCATSLNGRTDLYYTDGHAVYYDDVWGGTTTTTLTTLNCACGGGRAGCAGPAAARASAQVA